MKIHLLEPPTDFEHAECGIVGTWVNDDLCPACEHSLARRTEPFLVEWEPGSDVIGDFSWNRGDYKAIVVARVKDYLMKANFECDFGEVRVVPPTAPGGRRKRRVPFPYRGPTLYCVLPREQVRLNEKASRVRLEVDCPTCKQAWYTFRREHLVVDAAAWSGQKMFQIVQFAPSAATFVTQDGLDLLLSKGFTNIGHSEAGIIRKR
jgi:hypothetical protein